MPSDYCSKCKYHVSSCVCYPRPSEQDRRDEERRRYEESRKCSDCKCNPCLCAWK